MQISVLFGRPTARVLSMGTLALALTLLPLPALAAACPFDSGGSDAMNDGVVLTRYALGISGNPLVASTRYASLDPLLVKNNIECVGCALDINGDGQIDTVDTTIIARHLVGFKDASLSNGLTLGSGSRNTTSAVTSFLANGCAVGGALNAFTLGGNAFGDVLNPAVLGTTDGKPLIISVGSGSGLRMAISAGANTVGAISIASGSANNSAAGLGSTVAGGGFLGDDCNDYATNTFTRTCGNVASAELATVGGGYRNIASGSSSIVSGGGGNTASDFFSSVLGGRQNTASGYGSTVAGGLDNVASGISSFAAGRHARALHNNAFVWGGSGSLDTVSSAAGEFVVAAPGGVQLRAPTNLYFGSSVRQMINLYGTDFGIGIQTATQYYRSNSLFCWFVGGVHSDSSCTPGGGYLAMVLSSGGLSVNGTFVSASDRNIKENFGTVNAKATLAKVLSVPLSAWNYKADEGKSRHLGPMAQDFRRLFGLGKDDKTIAVTDASGVALAAIQGLHQLLKDKDAKISALEKANEAMQRDMALMRKRLGM